MLQRTSAGSVGEQALPRDIEPPHLPPPPASLFLTNFSKLIFHLLSLFSPPPCQFFPFLLFITVVFLFPTSPLPILPTEASKNKLSLCLPTALLLCKTARATWRSLKVHVPKSATGAPQLCNVGRGSLQLFFFAFRGPN